jgi:hypothetical protein
MAARAWGGPGNLFRCPPGRARQRDAPCSPCPAPPSSTDRYFCWSRAAGRAAQAEAEAAAREAARDEEQRHLRTLEADYGQRVARLEASTAAAERQATLEARARA